MPLNHPVFRRSRQRGSAIMVALFVIVIMGLLAAAMGRFLVDSGEKNTVEVRGVRALMAAQSGLEIGIYRLYPIGSPPHACGRLLIPSDSMPPGLVGCTSEIICTPFTVSAAGGTETGYQLTSEGRCGEQDLNSPSPDFAVSRTLEARALDGGTP